MSDHSAIEWTEATWNPTIGCTKVSPGCDRCYAERITHRFPKTYPNGFALTLRPHALDLPLLTNPFAAPLELACFDKHGANCICVYVDASEERRIAITQDLLAAHRTTCNDMRETRTRSQAEAEF